MKALKRIFQGLFRCFTGKNKLYNWVSIIGLVVRLIVLPMLLPNIFEIFADTMISSWGLSFWAYQIVIRIFLLIIDAIGLSNIFYWISYASVGNSYESGSDPAWGSICYTIYYLVYNILAVILFRFFVHWVIGVSFVVYFLICVAIYIVSYRLKTFAVFSVARIVIHAILTFLGFGILIAIRSII